MVLSNYKFIHIRIQDPEILIQGLQTYSSNYKYIPVMFSSNRIKIQENSINSTIRNRLLLQVIHFRNAFEAVALQSFTETSRTAILHEEVLQDSSSYSSNSSSNYNSNSTRVPVHHPSTIQHTATSTRAHPENSPSRNPILHAEGQRALQVLHYRFQKFYA